MTECYDSLRINGGKLDDGTPLIELYILAATLFCMIAISVDAIRGFRRRKFWFPCKFFTLNAASLTILAIMTKISVDLNNEPYHGIDQLIKLTGTLVISTAMSNFLPSLGMMRTEEVLVNVLALGILVVTMIVDVVIQIHATIIDVLIVEYYVGVFSLVFLFLVLGSTAVSVPTMKELLDKQYESKHRETFERFQIHTRRVSLKQVTTEIEKYWMMAHTSSPQFVVGRSATCTASGVICLLNIVILSWVIMKPTFCVQFRQSTTGEVICRCSSVKKIFFHSEPHMELYFFNFNMDWYNRNRTLIFITHCITILVGTVAPVCRWLSGISFSEDTQKGNLTFKKVINVEKYWTQRLLQWKAGALPINLSNRNWRKITYKSRNSVIDQGINGQKGIVILTKLISFLPVKFTNKILSVLKSTNRLCFCSSGGELVHQGTSLSPSTLVEEPTSHLDKEGESVNVTASSSSLDKLGNFVLHLEGEEGLVNSMEKRGKESMKRWIDVRKKKIHKDLPKFLKTSTDLKGVREFDNNLAPRIFHEEPSLNCWSLPIATLASIAIAISYGSIQPHRNKRLLRGVKQGLDYVNLIEKHLDSRGLMKMRQAGNLVWERLDIRDKWIVVDLYELANKSEKMHMKILNELAEISKKNLEEYLAKNPWEIPNEWPLEILASYAMYRITYTIQNNEQEQLKDSTDEELFTWLEGTISDILSACLTNLPRAAWTECVNSSMEKREESVRKATTLLAEAEVLNILDPGDAVGLVAVGAPGPTLIQYIDEWRKTNNLV